MIAEEAEPALPGVLAQIEAATDRSTALRIAAEVGGTVIYVCDRAGSAMVRLVGEVAAAAITGALGHGAVRVPTAARLEAYDRRHRILDMYRRGLSQREMARAERITIERVRQILRELD